MNAFAATRGHGKKLGFTGTRVGMTDAQLDAVRDFMVDRYEFSQLHHGDCKGADEQAHEVAQWVGHYIVTHPPNNEKLRAYCDADETRTPKEYLERDRDIVKECDHLLATPAQSHNVDRSGTWYTIRYAIKMGIPVTIIYPDGRVEQR